MTHRCSRGDLLTYTFAGTNGHHVWAYSPDGDPKPGNNPYVTLIQPMLGIYIGLVKRHRPAGFIAEIGLVYVYGLDVCVHLSSDWTRVN